MVVVLGADVHKKTHTFVAVDGNGCRLGELTVPATPDGHAQALAWACGRQHGAERLWAIEDCRTLSAGLERDLLAAGERSVRVPARLTAQTRASARTSGKSDPIDALAVARAALREPGLPGPSHDAAAEDLRLLSDRRDSLVAERTRAENRLRELLQRLDPAREPAKRTLDRARVRKALADWLAGLTGVAAAPARDILADIERLTTAERSLHKDIAARVKDSALLPLTGCGELSAARLTAQAGAIGRFPTPDAFAMFTGTAPVPVWSGNTRARVRLNRGGDRAANAALHRIAITQIRMECPGRDYYRRRIAEGKTKAEAIRCLKRRISNAVYRALQSDGHATATACPAAA